MAAATLAMACPGSRGGGGGGDGAASFRVFYPDAPATGFKAKVGKRFFAKPVAECLYENGRDARWSMTGARLEAGKLPPGLTLEEGAIGGTPIETGQWTVTVKFSGATCAGKSYDALAVDVTIVVSGADAKK